MPELPLHAAASNAPPLAAVCTPHGRGAVATIVVRGDCRLMDCAQHRLFRAVNGRELAAQPLRRIVFGRWGAEQTATEEVVGCRLDAATTEIHCHGGAAAIERILSDLANAGCQVVSGWQFAESRAGLLEMECQQALAHAQTERAAGHLLEQASGVLRAALERLAACLDREWPPHDAAAVTDGQSPLALMLAWAEFGLHLTQPWSVVLTGRPNVGKSSLINALLGYSRAIVFDEPGTTRDVVTAETAFGGWPVQLADTAGLRPSVDGLESAGIARARQCLANADCQLVVVDLSQPPDVKDQEVLAEWPLALVVGNKADLGNHWGEALPAGAILVSAVTGAGLEALVDAVARFLVPRMPPAGTAYPISWRQTRLLTQIGHAIDAGNRAEVAVLLAEMLQ